jgi:cell division protein FtsB
MAPAASTTTRPPRPRPRPRRAGARPANLRPPARSAPRRRRAAAPLRIRWERVGRVVLLVVLAVVVGLYVQQGLAYLSVRSQASRQTELVRRLSRENAQLARQESSLRNPATIVQDARALGMVRPGERPYVVTGQPGG